MFIAKPRWSVLSLLILALSSGAPEALGQLRLPTIFGDRMVVQRERPFEVWGWGQAGSQVELSFGEQRASVRVGADGRWSADLGSFPANAAGRSLLVHSAGQEIELADVLVGELWICGGQSNMEWTLRASRDSELELLSARTPQLRYLRLPHIAHPEAQDDIPVANPKAREGNWWPCTAERAQDCTAVGYYFGLRLHRCLDVPVGLIDASWGGTMAQHWVSRATLEAIPEMKGDFEAFAARRREWDEGGGEPGAQARFDAEMEAWDAAAKAAKESGEKAPGRPRKMADPSLGRQPAGMFNGMILPLVGLHPRGVLFYQGENNSFGEAWKPFPRTFPAVIRDWREAFGDPTLPFGIVQIAGWSTRRSMTYDMNHHTNIIREVQFRTWQQTANTGLIVSFDTNSNENIHPRHKHPVGDRSARWALGEVYAEAIEAKVQWRGPVFHSMEIAGDRLVLSFEEDTAPGLRLDKADDRGFYVAGADQVFHHARARVVKDQRVEVWCEEVPQPVAVRYGWSNLPLGTLMNGIELPAYPFRSDTWPLVPHQSQGAYEVGDR